MRFIFTSVLLITSVNAAELIQEHKPNTYKRTDFEYVIKHCSSNINNEYDAYKLIELIATGEGKVGKYSFNGVDSKLGTYEEHKLAFELLEQIGNKYGSGFYIPYGPNYDFVRTAINYGALNKWFEENKVLSEKSKKKDFNENAFKKIEEVFNKNNEINKRNAFNAINGFETEKYKKAKEEWSKLITIGPNGYLADDVLAAVILSKNILTEEDIRQGWSKAITIGPSGSLASYFIAKAILDENILTKEDIRQGWKNAITIGQDGFLANSFLAEVILDKNILTEEDIREGWKNATTIGSYDLLADEGLAKAIVKYKNTSGLFVISDQETLDLYNGDNPDLATIAEREIIDNRGYLSHHLTQGDQTRNHYAHRQDESIMNLNYVGFFADIKKLYEPKLTVELAVEKLKEELKKTSFYTNQFKEGISEEQKKGYEKVYKKYLEQFDRDVLLKYLPFVVEVIEKSGLGYEKFFDDFSQVIDANGVDKTTGDLKQSCRPEAFAVFGLRGYCIASFYSDSAFRAANPGMSEEYKKMTRESGKFFFNPEVDIIPLLGVANNQEELEKLILKKYQPKYGEYNEEYKNRIKLISDWFWKLKQEGQINEISDQLKQKTEFLRSLEENMSVISYALSTKDKLDIEIPDAINKMVAFLNDQIKKGHINYKDMDKEGFEMYIRNCIDSFFSHYGIQQNSYGAINVTKVLRNIQKSDGTMFEMQERLSLKTSIDKEIADLCEKYYPTQILSKEEEYSKYEQQLFEYAVTIQDRKERLVAIAETLGLDCESVEDLENIILGKGVMAEGEQKEVADRFKAIEERCEQELEKDK